ncbi:MAG: PAS domain S-box protein [Desulfobacterales bacterium]|nr:PAS domain S-box protein [Desulfobacterales bacterium]
MKQILVADNHPVFRKFMSDLLTEHGHDVVTANDGLSTLQLLESYTPDVVFIDLVMPNIDGNKLCQLIRGRPDLDHCFIVVLSAIAAEEDSAYLINLGADLVLAKGPFDRLAWQVDYIIKYVEDGRKDYLKGKTLGRKNLYGRQITEELLNSKRHYEMTLNHMSEGLLELTQNGEITYVNQAAVSITGISEEDLLSAYFTKFFKENDQSRIKQKISGVGRVWQEPILDEILELNGKSVYVKILSFHDLDQQYTMVAMLMDVTRQKQTEQELAKRKEQYRLERNFLDNLLENSPDAIAIVDEHGLFTRWNNNAEKMFGYNFEEMKGKKAFEFYADRAAMEDMLDQLRKQGSVQNYEITFKSKDGTSLPCAVSISLLHNENQEKIGSLSILRDLSEWKITEEKLRYLSFHDSLTGVYNRAFFEEEMQRLATGRNLPLGIIVCDINKLKRVNDSMGHQKGDELIRKAAEILKQAFRSGDIIARIGGDEFAVLVPQCNGEVLEDCIKRINEGIENYNSQRLEPDLSIAVGHAIKNEPPVDTKALFKMADDNMYLEKARHSQTDDKL